MRNMTISSLSSSRLHAQQPIHFGGELTKRLNNLYGPDDKVLSFIERGAVDGSDGYDEAPIPSPNDPRLRPILLPWWIKDGLRSFLCHSALKVSTNK